MLTKCINPKCSAQFRYLHDGKLFCFEGSRARQASASTQQEPRYFSCVWICNSCSVLLEPTVGPSGEVSVRPLRRRSAAEPELRA